MTSEIADFLVNLFHSGKMQELIDEEELDFSVDDVDTFMSQHLLTRDDGVVLKARDAEGEEHEYQITVIRSR